MSEQVRCTPTSSLGEILAHMCIRCMAIPTPHIISIIWHLLPMIVLIDVSLSHSFLSSSSSVLLSLPSSVSTLMLTLIHCMSAQNIEKGVDQIDLYLASGLGTSQDKIPKKDQVGNFSRLSSQQINVSLVFPIPLLARKHHLETFESRTARDLAPNVRLLLVSMLI